ncbi:ribosome silencing factor [Parvularcula sp. LCG005]|uniref:ribosome silencing factor n=1 Tax=Parvularcula sp. LCG005 TaxID=3078805 RepID=UPI00397A4C98
MNSLNNETASSDPQEILSLVLQRLDDDQAENIVKIDLEGKSDVADALIIASGRSQRHVGAMADKIQRELKEAGYGKVAVEGLPACDWVLIDAGDVIVHLFRPEVRGFYNLERIWAPEIFTTDTTSDFAPQTDAFGDASED